MKRFFKMIQKTYIFIVTYLSNISFALIFFIALWMGVDVIGRTAFNHPIAGTPELVKSLLPAIVFLSFAYTLRQKRHVNVEIIINKLPNFARCIFELLNNFLGFFIFCVIAFASWGPAWSGWLIKEYEGVQLKVPVYPVRFIIVFGAGIFAVQYLINMIENIREMVRNRNGAS
jgi:TRAP-type C4-dicarboxylate transport system permease small subunit